LENVHLAGREGSERITLRRILKETGYEDEMRMELPQGQAVLSLLMLPSQQ
jgi:hypothetical protein